jgi:hypothetical protein
MSCSYFHRGLGKTAPRGPASGSRCDVLARLTQGRVAPAKGNAKLPERPRDESVPREARPASLHRLVSQVAEQRQGPKASEGLDRHWHEGQGGGHLRIRASLANCIYSKRFRFWLAVFSFVALCDLHSKHVVRMPMPILGALKELSVALYQGNRPCGGRTWPLRRGPRAGPSCAVLPSPRLKWFGPVLRPVWGFWVLSPASLHIQDIVPKNTCKQ